MPQPVSEDGCETVERHKRCNIHKHKSLMWCRNDLKHA